MLSLLLLPLPQPGTVEDRLGVCIHLNSTEPSEFPQIRKVGIGAVRTDLWWPDVETSRGRYDFSKYDRIVAALRAQGLRPCFTIMGANRFYGVGPPVSDDARAGLAKFAGAAAARWRGGGIEFEIWNEPNHPGVWKATPHPQAYAALVKAAAEAIHTADPKARVLGGAVTEPMWPFLQDCFRSGMLDAVDAVSIHPYRPQRPESITTDVKRLRAMIARATSRKVGIVFSEMGYPMSYPGQDQNRRARYLTRSFLTSLAAGVDRFYVYEWKGKNSPGTSQWGFGLNDERLNPLPAGEEMKALMASLKGMRYEKRLPTAKSSDFALTFVGGGKRKTVSWTGAYDPATLADVQQSVGVRALSAAPQAKLGGRSVALGSTPKVTAGP